MNEYYRRKSAFEYRVRSKTERENEIQLNIKDQVYIINFQSSKGRNHFGLSFQTLSQIILHWNQK